VRAFRYGQPVRQRDQLVRWHRYVLGVRARRRQAEVREFSTGERHSGRAGAALAAGAERIDGDRLTDPPVGHARADLGDPPAELVAENLTGRCHPVLDRVHVGPAQAACLDRDHNLARPGHRVRNIRDLGTVRHTHHCSHATPPISYREDFAASWLA